MLALQTMLLLCIECSQRSNQWSARFSQHTGCVGPISTPWPACLTRLNRSSTQNTCAVLRRRAWRSRLPTPRTPTSSPTAVSDADVDVEHGARPGKTRHATCWPRVTTCPCPRWATSARRSLDCGPGQLSDQAHKKVRTRVWPRPSRPSRLWVLAAFSAHLALLVVRRPKQHSWLPTRFEAGRGQYCPTLRAGRHSRQCCFSWVHHLSVFKSTDCRPMLFLTQASGRFLQGSSRSQLQGALWDRLNAWTEPGVDAQLVLGRLSHCFCASRSCGSSDCVLSVRSHIPR